jgi:Leucine-rich repeat (LRR) protein
VPGPVVCFLDEIDSTLKLAWTDDLFTAIRGLYNERSMVLPYERITFCLIGVATPNELIKDRRTTPYNVGIDLELRDFDPDTDDLSLITNALHTDPVIGNKLLCQILYWTGGHPYLTIKSCVGLKQCAASDTRQVDTYLHDSFPTLDGLRTDTHFQSILRFIDMRLSDDLTTLDLYKRVLDGVDESDEQSLAHSELKLSGLVKRDAKGRLRVRNRIYSRLFNADWVASTEPMRRAEHARRSLDARERLASLNISIGQHSSKGITVRFPESASQETFDAAIPLLTLIGDVVSLDIENTDIQTVSSLGCFPSLLILNLAHTPVGDISVLETLRGIEQLDISGTKITTVANVAMLEKLQILNVSRTSIGDFEPLADLVKLRSLKLGNTGVRDLTPFRRLENLIDFSLPSNEISDLSPIACLKRLETLSLSDTGVTDLTPIASLQNLSSLNIDFTKVNDVGPLAKLNKLEVLEMAFTLATDLRPLSRLTRLKTLWLQGTAASDIGPLSVLKKLETLVLSGSKVTDISAVAELGELRTLFLGRTNVKDLSPLFRLKKLAHISLDEDPALGDQVSRLRQVFPNATIQVGQREGPAVAVAPVGVERSQRSAIGWLRRAWRAWAR